MAPTVQRKSSSCPGERETEKHWKLLRGEKVKEKNPTAKEQNAIQTPGSSAVAGIQEKGKIQGLAN